MSFQVGQSNCGQLPSSATIIAVDESIDSAAASDAGLIAHDDESHLDVLSRLNRLQETSFWYRSRNRLITQLASRHFRHAQSVIEIGCGTGYVLSALRAGLPSSRLVGGDVSSRALYYAGKRALPNVDLIQMDICAIPSVAEFDLVCAFDVLEHVEDDEATLARFHRGLRPGGGILLSVPQHPLLWSEADVFKGHKRRYRRGELDDKCRRAGFELLASTSFVTSLLPAMLLQRLGAAYRSHYDPMAEHALPGWCGRLFEWSLDAEARAIGLGLSLPVGGSRFVAARVI
jgi:SAM-dependent methyltransferase